MNYFLLILTILFLSACSESNINIVDDNDTVVNDNPLLYQQWSINKDTLFYANNEIDENAHINPEKVFNSLSGKSVKVAVIDDGFDINHPELRDKIIKTVSVSKNGIIGSDVTHIHDYEFHGTAVAGIIAAANNNIGILGIAPDVELILIRMPVSLSDDVTIELFQQAVDAGADVINCSWGTDDVRDSVREYIDYISTYARDGKGVIIIFASGNMNSDMGNDESAIESVIGVGATDKTNLRTNYSNYGKELDIVAPGGDMLGITTLDPLGESGESSDEYNRYDEMKSNGTPISFIGTSASAPIMSGVIALALEKDASLTRIKIQELLRSSTSTIGQNTPYIDDMIISSSSTPTITGIYGSLRDIEFQVRLKSKRTGTTYGLYYLYETKNGEWKAEVTDNLIDDIYSIEVVSESGITIWATDKEFEVKNSSAVSKTDKTKRKSDLYGYGKIDLSKFINNI